MTRVLIGDALVNENERLQARINALLDKVEAAIKQALRVAATQENLDAGRRFRRPGQPAALLRRRPLDQYARAASRASRWRNGRSSGRCSTLPASSRCLSAAQPQNQAARGCGPFASVLAIRPSATPPRPAQSRSGCRRHRRA
jgi:hypothetical protein